MTTWNRLQFWKFKVPEESTWCQKQQVDGFALKSKKLELSKTLGLEDTNKYLFLRVHGAKTENLKSL